MGKILKLNKIFHPEILLGKKGSSLLIDQYKYMMEHCKFLNGKFAITSTVITERSKDADWFTMLYLFKVYKEMRGQIFHFSKSLFEALDEVDDIPIEALPKFFVGYISFPNQCVFDDDGDEYQGAYIWIDETSKMPLSTKDYQYAISIAAISKNVTISEGSIISMRAGIPENESTILRSDEPENVKRTKLYNTIVKCILFIASGDPDLTHLKPLGNRSKTQAKKTDMTFCETTSLPITLVGWDWVPTPKEYKTNIWYRKAHFSKRWSGEGKQILKPVFVKVSWPQRKIDE